MLERSYNVTLLTTPLIIFHRAIISIYINSTFAYIPTVSFLSSGVRGGMKMKPPIRVINLFKY